MTTTQPHPAVKPIAEIPSTVEAIDCDAALITSPTALQEPRHFSLDPKLAPVPVELDVAVPVEGFRVRNLLALEAGQVIEARWAQGDDVPLAAGKAQLAWCEFEVLDSRLAVRLTRLA